MNDLQPIHACTYCLVCMRGKQLQKLKMEYIKTILLLRMCLSVQG